MSASAQRRTWRDHWRRMRPLYLVILACAAPVIASYLAYYVFQPRGRTNYGELVEPQRPVPKLALRALDGTPFDLASLRGNWIMVTVDQGQCADRCRAKLWNMRQVRTATGRERERIERVVMFVDDAPTTTLILREFEGTLFLRASAAKLAPFLDPTASDATKLDAPIWLIDPLGNLMLRWPGGADPSRMKRDLDRLLRASRVG